MNKFELTNRIEKFAPLDSQEKWDCSGWLICTRKLDVTKVMLALTITDDVVNQAREQGCDMIISHHPLFYIPLEYADIDMYCAHTNMDKAEGGTTDTIIKTLGLKSDETVNDFVRIVNLQTPLSISELGNLLKKISPNLRYTNNKNTDKIKRIAFCAGSGSEFISETNADAFVTGDLKFHSALDSECVVFDIGHFESEILILPVFEQILGIDVIYATEKSPFIHNL